MRRRSAHVWLVGILIWAFVSATANARPLLSPVPGSPFAAGASPASVAVSTKGFVATANYQAGTVSVFAVGSHGALSSVAGSPFAIGENPQGLAFSPDGSLLATANPLSDTVSVFSVSGSGALTPIPGSPFTTDAVNTHPSYGVGVPGDTHPVAVAFGQDNSTLVTANPGNSSFSFMTVSHAGGAYYPGSPFSTGAGTKPVSIVSGGRLIATANSTSDSVSILYATPPCADGSCVPQWMLADPPSSTGPGSDPVSVAFNSATTLLAVADQGGAVSMFDVQGQLSLTPISGSPFSTGPNSRPSSVQFSPDGNLLTAADTGTNGVSAFYVDDTGALTQVDGSPFSTGPGSSPVSLAFSVHGGLLATADQGNNAISMFSVLRPPQQISDLRLSPAAFRPAHGATITYRDTLPATAVFSFWRAEPGVRARRGCVKPSRRENKTKPCMRWVMVGSFKHQDRSGQNSVFFTGRRLPVGSYLLTARAILNGHAGPTASTRFRIL